jgi:ArsR family transcriptional regulator, arsenate/arsenite/antimonite-responsive transcriptional repressor
VARQQLPVLQESSVASVTINRGAEERAARLVALGRALSDPIRVRMLGMLAEGRGCCELPDCGVPAQDQDAGICVCEFERYFDAAQSKVSYHLGKLKEAGLVHEVRRGKWSFYSLDRETAGQLIAETAAHLDGSPDKDG